MTEFNKNKPYGDCSGLTTARYFQKGHYFDANGVEVTEDGDVVAPKKYKKIRFGKEVKNHGNVAAFDEFRELQAKAKAMGCTAKKKVDILAFIAEHESK